jgi:hypothetical protein
MQMATFTWTTTSNNNWGLGSNWNPSSGAPPGGSTTDTDVAIITNVSSGGGYTVTVATSTTFDIL